MFVLLALCRPPLEALQSGLSHVPLLGSLAGMPVQGCFYVLLPSWRLEARRGALPDDACILLSSSFFPLSLRFLVGPQYGQHGMPEASSFNPGSLFAAVHFARRAWDMLLGTQCLHFFTAGSG